MMESDSMVYGAAASDADADVRQGPLADVRVIAGE